MATSYTQRDVGVFDASGTRDIVAVVARVLLVAIFLMSSFGKITGFAGRVVVRK